MKGHSRLWDDSDLIAARDLRTAIEGKRNEIVLRQYAEREQLSTAAIESSNDAVNNVDVHGRIVRWNQAAVGLFGFAAIDAIGNNVEIVVPLNFREEVKGILATIRNGGNIKHHETVRATKDGHPVTVSLSVSPIRSSSGEVIGAIKVARDMSERNRTQQALYDSEKMARGIIETALDAFIQLNEFGIVVEWSPNAEALFGWPQHEAVGRALRDFVVPPEHRIQHLERIAEVLRRVDSRANGLRFEVPALRCDGAMLETEISLTAFRRRNGYVVNAFVRDVTLKLLKFVILAFR